MNTQFAIQNATGSTCSRSIRAPRGPCPSCRKRSGHSAGEDRRACMAGVTLSSRAFVGERRPYYSVKESVFPFAKFLRRRSDPRAGDEVHRRGHGDRPFLRRGLCEGPAGRRHGAAARRCRVDQRARPGQEGAVELARILVDRGFELVATSGTAKAIAKAGVPCRSCQQGARGPAAYRRHDQERRDQPDRQHHRQANRRSASRIPSGREAVHRKVTYYTTLAAAKATCEALDHLDATDVNRLQDLHAEVAP
jgi:carbamoyl-phosphate synthase large subunit